MMKLTIPEFIWYNGCQHERKENIIMPTSDAQKRALKKYQDKRVQVKFWLNPETEAPILKKLNSVEVKGQYIKDLILKDIEKGGK